MFGARPPGSPEVAEPLFIPFGGVYFGIQFFEQLFAGDFGDSLFILLLTVIPLIIYTFVISVLIHYVFLKIRHKQNNSA